MLRFIPACAGNAVICVLHFGVPPVHPRMRGERSAASFAPDRTRGSSPHARGTPSPDAYRSWQTRFIPACAGNAIFVMTKFLFLSVHPRMRGERFRWLMIPCKCSGSSPHARGTLSISTPGIAQFRFIPACAGNATPTVVRNMSHAVHPRMRGERLQPAMERMAFPGSSPHARGTPPGRLTMYRYSRFIPACAGNAIWIFSVVI